MEAKAIAKYVRMSPTKVGVVLDLARGKDVGEIFTVLKYTPRDAVEIISKALESAIANTENDHESDANKLLVAETHTGHRPILRKFGPMNHDKTFRINKRASNIALVVKERA